jgi:hypothetical protein
MRMPSHIVRPWTPRLLGATVVVALVLVAPAAVLGAGGDTAVIGEVVDTALDDTALDDTALDDPALDDPALDDPALDDTALDDTALDDTALDDTAGQDPGPPLIDPEPLVTPPPNTTTPPGTNPDPGADNGGVSADNGGVSAERIAPAVVPDDPALEPSGPDHEPDHEPGHEPDDEIVSPVEIVSAGRPADDGDPGLRAQRYDGIYAQGVPVWVAMTATRELESGGDYQAEARGSTASGAYQVIDSTWNNYGGYRRATDAPPAVQDQFAYESMVVILKRYGNDVSSIPLAWYYPAALGNELLMDVVPVPQAGNVLTPRQYQARWMAAFHRHLEAGSPVYLPADSNPLIPAIAFPVLGPTTFWDDWHAPRDGGARRHEGLDFMGVDGQPLRAAFDGVVTRLRPDNVGLPGVGITITREDGLRANYFHLDASLRWHPHLDVGARVKAGQVIGYMGSTGNAGIPHLHFELRTPDGEPMAPYPAVLEAVQREQCSVGIGPWSTVFASPAEIYENLAAAAEAARAAGVELADLVRLFQPDVFEVEGSDDARWTVDTHGGVKASGVGALIAPSQGGCANVPDGVYGTNAEGLGIDLLPAEWWGDEVDPEDLAAMVAAVAQERSGEFDEPMVSADDGDAFIRMMTSRRILTLVVAPPGE